MGFFAEFKQFAMRGNVMDMAVGIVIGAAFKDIVTSLVNKIIMPLAGVITQGENFADRSTKIEIEGLAEGANAPEIGWGAFVQSTIDFIIVAFAIFCVIKMVNSFQKEEEEAPAKTPEDIELLREIRDSLKKA